MDINEIANLNGTITLKDANGTDTQVAYLSASIGGESQIFNISMNIQNKTLLNSNGAANTSGETAQQQYTEFETAVKGRAKELGFSIFA